MPVESEKARSVFETVPTPYIAESTQLDRINSEHTKPMPTN